MHKVLLQIVTFLILVKINLWASGDSPVIMVVHSRGEVFEETISGMKKELSGGFKIEELSLNERSDVSWMAREIFSTDPKLIVLMDNKTIELYRNYQSDYPHNIIPAIACLGIDLADEIQTLKNAECIAYEIPIYNAISEAKNLFSKPVKKVGIISRRFMVKKIDASRALCRNDSIELELYILPDIDDCTNEIIRGIKKLCVDENIDMLWIPNDNIILDAKYLKHAWMPLIQKFKIPVIASNTMLVNPALDFGTIAIVPDLFGLGVQLAQKILIISKDDWELSNQTVDFPFSIRRYINMNQMIKKFDYVKESIRENDILLNEKPGENEKVVLEEKAKRDTSLSLGNIYNLDISSVSKRSEHLQDVATSIYVITEEDIRRSGASRLQDVLNMVPGVWVADQNYWTGTIGIREAADWLNTSVNAYLDGVPIINPYTGSLSFDTKFIPLQNIKRIEVIKGPGGVIYGANSATGIINIFTKNAESMNTINAGTSIGTRKHFEPYAQGAYHFQSSPVHLSYFASCKFHDGFDKNPEFSEEYLTVSGNKLLPSGIVPVNDTTIRNNFNNVNEGKSYCGTGRFNIEADPSPVIHLSGSVWGSIRQTTNYFSKGYDFPETPFEPIKKDSTWLDDSRVSDVTVNGKISFNFSENHNAFFHSYYNYNNLLYSVKKAGITNSNYTYTDFEFQDNFTLFASYPFRLKNSIGANCRLVKFNVDESKSFHRVFTESNKLAMIYAGFIQSTLSFRQIMDLTFGAKGEKWTLISAPPEISPSIRLAIKPHSTATLWGAWSRSVTVPGYVQTNIEMRNFATSAKWAYGAIPSEYIPAGAGKWICAVSNDNIKPAVYKTTEVGLRSSAIPRSMIDISGFYSLYNDKVDLTPIDLNKVIQSRIDPSDSIIPVYNTNLLKGKIYGVESVFKTKPFTMLSLEISYSLLKIIEEGQVIPGTDQMFQPRKYWEHSSPQNIIRGKLYLDLPASFFATLNALWRSKYNDFMTYDYIAQTYYPIEYGGVKTVSDQESSLLKFDVQVEKGFFSNKLFISLWGRNLMFNTTTQKYVLQTVESYTWYHIFYPNTVHPLYGGSIRYSF
jgi:outer membrane receptor for ferrienterochelin and colicin/ABC-type uncharacterized transport system substrate-binding protein